uniref:Reverse transcriptase domain-containing protein n=1 Tax=Tanacetum cinerariifolium TaxID=118510 RepID=A0A6L2LIH0_TANCI|nr:hypothetical protein [Tanacetum cinerariifolium]
MSFQDMKDLKQPYLDEMKSLINSEYRNEIKINERKENFNGMSIEINKKKKLQQLEQVANLSTYPSQHFNSFCYDDDDDDDDEDYTIAITPDFPNRDSLSMGDVHLSTIPETKSNEFIKSSVKNLVQNPSESEDECKCDVPDCDDSQMTIFLTFSNSLFDDSTSSDDESSHEESYLLESLLNRDSLMASSPKFDSLIEKFSGELAHTDLIPPGINKANCDPEEDIHLVKRLLYNNSSHRPTKEFNSKNSDAIIESFSPSPIPVEDSDSLIEEIDLFLTPDDSMPSGIENDEYDSERDILFLEELLSNDSLSLSENKSFHFDVPSSSHPPAKPPDDDEIELDIGILSTKVVDDISELYVLKPSILPTQPTLVSNEENSHHLLSHRGFKAF